MPSPAARLVQFSAALLLAAAPARAATFKTMFHFKGGNDGQQPAGNLVAQNGTLYGATLGSFAMAHFNCGSPLCGTAFAYDIASGKLKNLHTFTEDSDGYFPQSGLVQIGKTLYGIDFGGGAGYGVVFSVDSVSGHEKTIYVPDEQDATVAYEAPVAHDLKLYGTTSSGAGEGASGSNGTIYQIDTKTGARTILYSFQGGTTDGCYPVETPVVYHDMLYGTTAYGGKFGDGTIWQYNLKTGEEKIVFNFHNNADGKFPSGSFVVSNGLLYGTINTGGVGFGALYSFDPVSHKLAVIHAFNGGTEGSYPGPLVVNAGQIYVSTAAGGVAGWGTVDQIDPATGDTTVVHSFAGEADGIWPGTLVSYQGTVYGLTQTTYPFVWLGTLFSITP